MNQSNRSTLLVVVSIFFFFGFVASSNNILIPAFRSFFELSQVEAQLVDFAFYLSYFAGSLIYLIYSITNGDLLNRIGYKKGLLFGLGLSFVGALLIVLAAQFEVFGLFLVALFVIGFGFSLQQIVLNPFLLSLGSPETGSRRINIAGSVNSFATMVAPLILSKILFGTLHSDEKITSLAGLIPVAGILAFFFLLAIFVIWRSNIEVQNQNEPMIADFQISKYPELTLGILAIFVYVGVEVTIGSNMGELLKREFHFPDQSIGLWVSLYWGSLMIGRWAGSSEVFWGESAHLKLIKFCVPFLAFGLILGVNLLIDNDIKPILPYGFFVGIASLAFVFSGYKAGQNLALLGIMGAVSFFLGLTVLRPYSILLFVSGGLYLSVMWSCIFEIATKNLGKYTNIGSSLLIMMIIGGGLIPLFQGYISDQCGIFVSYWIPLVGFVYLAGYGMYARNKKM